MSSNKEKYKEVQSILKSSLITVLQVERKMKEIQSSDMNEIAIDKCINAFIEIGRPTIVEHTGLFLDDLNELPGGLTGTLWEKLGKKKFCKYFSANGKCKATAKSIIAYCDGKQVRTFEGKIKGIIVASPRGKFGFKWDSIFQPDACKHKKTFAEMTTKEKNKISMRKEAVEKLREYLEEEYSGR